MSKYVKDLVTESLRKQFEGVEYALLVNVVGLNAVRTTTLRKELRDQDIHLCVIKNSLARRATEGTALAAAFEGLAGTTAVVWGATDVVALAKTIVKYKDDKAYAGFEARGGVLDGAKLTGADVAAVSKWPSREEQLSILVGQILSPGALLASQLTSVGGALASQIKQRGEEEEGGEAPAAEEAPAAT
jgi:large subunit ribosomal protein L10